MNNTMNENTMNDDTLDDDTLDDDTLDNDMLTDDTLDDDTLDDSTDEEPVDNKPMSDEEIRRKEQRDNVLKLKALFPSVVIEGIDDLMVDINGLKLLVGDKTGVELPERYGYGWYGKSRANHLALLHSNGTLLPSRSDSTDWDTTRNVFIEGDNLEVLRLLQGSYSGKVKMIYIDPPYNTGNDFVYPDNFKNSIKSYLELTGQTESGRIISSNTETGGRFHTAWLNMMYPRLILGRNLLKRDGAIFVSCDENEYPRLRMMMDEIFGLENFVADMVWAAGIKSDSKLISASHEYIVCYAKEKSYLSSQKVKWRQRKKGLEEIYAQYEKLRKEYDDDYSAMTSGMKKWYKQLPDNHPSKAHKHFSNVDWRGIYSLGDISAPGRGNKKYEVLHPVTGKPVKIPVKGWMTPDPEKLKKLIDDDRVVFGKDEKTIPSLKSYLKEHEYRTPYSVFYQSGTGATNRLRELMGDKVFDFPKDETVIQELIEMMTSGDDIIVDFFAGSGTTGQAVMAQNAVDNGSRRFVLVQLPEPLDVNNKNQVAAAKYCDAMNKPRNIAELTKERLRRAGKMIKENNPAFTGDTGFRTFKLASSNIKEWDPHPVDYEQALRDRLDILVEGRTDQDIIYQLLIEHGFDLCEPIDKYIINDKEVHFIGGEIIVCLAPHISEDDVRPLVTGIMEQYNNDGREADNVTCVFRDSAFRDPKFGVCTMTNVQLIFQQYDIHSFKWM